MFLLVKYIHFIHMYTGKSVTQVSYDRPGTIGLDGGSRSVQFGDFLDTFLSL